MAVKMGAWSSRTARSDCATGFTGVRTGFTLVTAGSIRPRPPRNSLHPMKIIRFWVTPSIQGT